MSKNLRRPIFFLYKHPLIEEHHHPYSDIIQSANHVAAVQYSKSCGYRLKALGNDHGDIDLCIVVGDRQADLSISETADLLEF